MPSLINLSERSEANFPTLPLAPSRKHTSSTYKKISAYSEKGLTLLTKREKKNLTPPTVVWYKISVPLKRAKRHSLIVSHET